MELYDNGIRRIDFINLNAKFVILGSVEMVKLYF